MLAFEDENVRKMFAVYVRPEGERGEINFYDSEADAQADVGPGMPAGVITHGDTYVEYIGDVLLYAPIDWPLIGVDQDLLVQLAADGFEIFVGLTPAESDVLLSVVIADDETAAVTDLEDVVEIVNAPASLSGDQPCAAWMPSGQLVIFSSGPDSGGVDGRFVLRPEFEDEIGTDRGVVALLDSGWVPLVDDPHSWRENDDCWAINIQQRVHDEDELFLGRYAASDRTLVVTRSGADTEDSDEHLQLIAEELSLNFNDLNRKLAKAGWKVDVDSQDAAEMSVHAELSESPGWYPVETDDGVEWVAALLRTP